MRCPSILPHAQHGQGLGLKGTAGSILLEPGIGMEPGRAAQTSSSLNAFCLYFPFPAERCSTSSISFWDYTHGYSILLCPQAG